MTREGGAGRAAVPRLAAIHVYPLKGAAGIRVPRWRLDAFGPLHDRRWMITDPDGEFVSQRSTPALARVRTALEGDALVLRSDRVGRELRLPLGGPGGQGGEPDSRQGPSAPGHLHPVMIWGDRVEAEAATDPPEEGDGWISEALGRPLHLVRMPDDARRPVPPDSGPLPDSAPPLAPPLAPPHGETRADGGPPRVSFADGYPLLVISESSLEELNRRLRASGEAPVPMDRFRPNLVVSGVPAHDEDTWASFQVGDLRLRGLKGCARCSVTTVDQSTGRRRSKEPLRTLALYRRGPRDEGKVWFGQNAVHLDEGELVEGMPVLVETRGAPVGPPSPPGSPLPDPS